jgi:erythromycin esterase-like protein
MAHAGHSGMYTYYGITPMGNHLKQRHPNDYFTIGLFTNGGTVRVVNTSIPTPVLGEFKIDPKPEHYLTQAFAKGKWSQFFLPMNAVNQNSELKALFNKPIKFYFIGATTEKVSIEQNLLMGYDAIVFLEKTSATKPN